MACFIGIAKNPKVTSYCEINRCILDNYKDAHGKYEEVKQGDIGFIYDKQNDNLLYGFRAKSGPEPFPDTQFEFRIKNIRTNMYETIRLDLKIPLDTIDTEIKKKIGGAKELLESAGVAFPYTYPEPRVYSDEVAQNILKSLEIKSIETAPPRPKPQPILGQFKGFDENIIGLNNIKKYVRDLIQASRDEDNCKKYNLQICRGFFLFGPPGTGKTIFAKSVSKELGAEELEISPSIIAGFPGEAEKEIEKLLEKKFEAFQSEKRGVTIFDEADALFPKRRSGMSTVMERIVPTFLRVIDDLLKDQSYRYCPIFLFAISNHPEAIDDAFLRPGRFANLFYVGLPSDKEEYEKLFEFYLNSRKEVVDRSVLENLDQIVKDTNERSMKEKKDYNKYLESLKENKPDIHEDYGKFSPADIQEIINEAALKACLSNQSISLDTLKTVIDNTTPSVINEILNKNEGFRKTHPHAKLA